MAIVRYNLIQKLMQDRAGASAAEFVLVLPILTILLFGAIDVGMLAWKQMQVGAAARAGASYALTNGFNQAGIEAAANDATDLTVAVDGVEKFPGCALAASGIEKRDVGDTSNCPDGKAPGQYVKVRMKTGYSPIFGWGLSDSELYGDAEVRIS